MAEFAKGTCWLVAALLFINFLTEKEQARQRELETIKEQLAQVLIFSCSL